MLSTACGVLACQWFASEKIWQKELRLALQPAEPSWCDFFNNRLPMRFQRLNEKTENEFRNGLGRK